MDEKLKSDLTALHNRLIVLPTESKLHNIFSVMLSMEELKFKHKIENAKSEKEKTKHANELYDFLTKLCKIKTNGVLCAFCKLDCNHRMDQNKDLLEQCRISDNDDIKLN